MRMSRSDIESGYKASGCVVKKYDYVTEQCLFTKDYNSALIITGALRVTSNVTRHIAPLPA